MRTTGSDDETGAGENAHGFFEITSIQDAPPPAFWEDRVIRFLLKLLGVAVLYGLAINVLLAIADWWWL